METYISLNPNLNTDLARQVSYAATHPPLLCFHTYFLYLHLLIEPQNHSGWKRPLRSASPTPAHPTVPTAHLPQCHISHWTPPGTVTPPPPWAAVPLHHHTFRGVFPNIHPESCSTGRGTQGMENLCCWRLSGPGEPSPWLHIVLIQAEGQRPPYFSSNQYLWDFLQPQPDRRSVNQPVSLSFIAITLR